MRLWLLVLIACGAHASAITPPGLRLPAGVTPLAYELRLELDPDIDTFRGEVRIRARLDAPTDHVWLHADELDITQATADGKPLTQLGGEAMRAFGFGHAHAAGEITLALSYTGHARHDQEGMFRQRDRDRWYMFTQGESALARRFVPCFDEPRFKTPWQITLDVPRGQVALSNMPAADEKTLPGGRREIAFPLTPPIPSYLVAVAVGPFELVDAGRVGRGKIPLRVAALRGDRDKVGVVADALPGVISDIEAYLDSPLPWPKLDLVAVPHFFGAMENPGLVTIEASTITGDPKWLRAHFLGFASHEIVHQWFGNLVTFEWWDDLWLAEAFASWLGDKLVIDARRAPLDLALARERALQADAEPGAKPLRPAIATAADVETGFGPIAYDKGRLVLAMLERWIGEDKLRDELRAFVRAHARGTATTEDLALHLGPAGPVLRELVEKPGAPVVEIAIRCEAKPVVSIHVRDGRTLPVCVRTDLGRTCELVHDRAELAQARCPAWVVGNDGGLGYYEVLGPAAATRLAPAEQIARGNDVASALARGDIALPAALAELSQLAHSRDPYAVHGAAAIARVIDPIVDDRAKWSAWLGAQLADRLTPALLSPQPGIERQLREDLAQLSPDIPDALARAAVERLTREPDAELAVFARSPAGEFERFVDLARAAQESELRDALLVALGGFDAAHADRALDVFLDSRAPLEVRWLAISGYFDRAATRQAAWHAVHNRLSAVLAQLLGHEDALFDALATLCDESSRGEVATSLAGHALLPHALGIIDGCIARKHRLGQPQL